jgi:hypothetical protein
MTEVVKKIILENKLPLYGKVLMELFENGNKFTINQYSYRDEIYDEFEKEGLITSKKYEVEKVLDMAESLIDVEFTPKGLEIAKKFKEENKDMKFPFIF